MHEQYTCQRQSKTFADPTKLNILMKLARTGEYSAPDLARVFECNVKTIHGALNAQDIKLLNLGRFRKTIHCDAEFFSTMTPPSAYWAGFLAADGGLSSRDKSIRLVLNRSDAVHVRKFKDVIKTNAKIFYVESVNAVGISIACQELYDALVALGIEPNKSLRMSKVNVPEHLISHFIRGVFDGDGCLSGKDLGHIQFMIAGNKPFLEELQSALIKNCELRRVKIYPTKSQCFKLQYTGSQVFRILDFIYKDSNEQTRLRRKFQKYLLFKSNFGR